MAAVFTAVFYTADAARLDLGLRVLLGLLGALVTGFAEGWFFTRDLLRQEACLVHARQRVKRCDSAVASRVIDTSE